MTAHPLTEVRERQHHAETDWLSVAQEGICEVLRRQDTVHANDLYALGIPDAACNVAGSAFASYLGKGWIVSTGERRASTKPSRNCGKSAVYRATSKFPRPATAGVSTDGWGSKSLPSVAVSAHSGDISPGDRHNDAAPVEAVSGGSSATPGESARLFELPPDRPPHDRVPEAA
jgi:hypothetical protein